MQKPETKIVKKIEGWFKCQPKLFYFKVHGSMFQMAGVPDLIGCYKGMFFGVEVKVPGEVPTKLQTKVMQIISDAGGKVSVVTSLEQVKIMFQTMDMLAWRTKEAMAAYSTKKIL